MYKICGFDSPSSGERTGNMPKPYKCFLGICWSLTNFEPNLKDRPLFIWCYRAQRRIPVIPVVYKAVYSQRSLERDAKEGDRPVGEIYSLREVAILSRPGHEKSRLNLGRLWSKAKYF